MYRLACGPLNNKTPAVATDRLLCVPPCVCTAFCVHRLACAPLNNKTPAAATGRLSCVPPCVCTAFPPHTPPPTFSTPPLPPPPTSPPYLPPLPPPTPPLPPPTPPYLQGRGGGDFVRYMGDLDFLGRQRDHWSWARLFFLSTCAIVSRMWPGDSESVTWRCIGEGVWLEFFDEQINKEWVAYPLSPFLKAWRKYVYASRHPGTPDE